MNFVAFIGTRHKVSQVRLDAYRLLVEQAIDLGFGVVTGAAAQCDQIAGERATVRLAPLHLVLPWFDYEQSWVTRMRAENRHTIVTVYDPRRVDHVWWAHSVHKYHPSPSRLTDGAIMLHARNYGIVEASVGVIALPSMGGGGTTQALRIAEKACVRPTFDLRYDGAAQHAADWLRTFRTKRSPVS